MKLGTFGSLVLLGHVVGDIRVSGAFGACSWGHLSLWCLLGIKLGTFRSLVLLGQIAGDIWVSGAFGA